MNFQLLDSQLVRIGMHRIPQVDQQLALEQLEVFVPTAGRFLQSNKESNLTKSFEVAYQLQMLVE
jgi:hypothetical protein